jgi:thioredoxin-related protein
MKKLIGSLFIYLPSFLLAQSFNNYHSVEWVNTLNWEQIKQRASAENKYIFLDCYATWCGPCKKMDKEVFSNDTIVEFINKNFIPVKVQMDTSKNDDEMVKKWYMDADKISKTYKVNAFPTFLFFSPSGDIVHKGAGYRTTQLFFDLGQDALNPDKQYYNLLKQYQSGEKDYLKMPYIVNTAYYFNEESIANEVAEDYIANYLLKLPEDSIFTSENLMFIRGFTRASKDPAFQLFYKKGIKIDKIMNDQFFSESLVTYVISKEEIDPLLIHAVKDPNWDSLALVVSKKYTKYYSNRAITDAKIRFYQFEKNWPEFTKNTTFYLQLYGYGLSDYELAIKVWDLFQRSVNKSELTIALRWAKVIIDRSKDSTNIIPNTMDTYANLSYKIYLLFGDPGYKQKALDMEEKALSLMIKYKKEVHIKIVRETLEKMKQGVPTWSMLDEKKD